MLPTLPSIAEAKTLMRQGKLRPIDLVEHCLGRIHQFDDQIHAWVMVDEEGARAEARRLGKMLDDGQEPVGPLHGIPIGIKDIIDVAGWPTLCGSKLREGHVAEKDAFVVKNLRDAGAIILGKTVTTEWASFDPPPTRNPWNLNHTPGGSSSGSAAAVALEMCLAALGTQTGGSIVRPASYCGVVGLKPTVNEIEMEGIFPFSRSLDHVGPIARSVNDIEEFLRVPPHGLRNTEAKSTRLRLLALEGGFLEGMDDPSRRHFANVKSILGQHLAITSLPMPDCFSEIHTHHRRIMAVEGAETHRTRYEQSPDAFSKQIRCLVEEGRNTSVLDYALALRRQQELRDVVRDEFDLHREHATEATVIIMPSTPTTAPDRSVTGNPVFNSIWSFLGLASITIPTGIDEAGLPFGLQIVATDFFAPNILRVARKCESAIKFELRPPLLQ